VVVRTADGAHAEHGRPVRIGTTRNDAAGNRRAAAQIQWYMMAEPKENLKLRVARSR
jgi:hypothetical protein